VNTSNIIGLNMSKQLGHTMYLKRMANYYYNLTAGYTDLQGM